jgi:hypothetical protein
VGVNVNARVLAVIVATAAGALGLASVARATYRGVNGPITWEATETLHDLSQSATYDALKTNAMTVAACADSICRLGTPNYSPSGSEIVVSRQSPSGTAGALLVARADGTHQRVLRAQTTDDEHPAFLPGPSRLVFDGRAGGRVNLYSVRTDGTDLRRLTSGGGEQPAPCSNGTIAFVRPARGLFLLGPDRRHVRRIASGLVSSPSCAPDGSRVAFIRRCDLYTVSPTGAHLRRVLAGSGRTDNFLDGSCVSAPAYSPDGREVASLLSYETGPGNALVVLCVATLNRHVAGPPRTIAFNGGSADEPSYTGASQGVAWRPLSRAGSTYVARQAPGSPARTPLSDATGTVAFDRSGRLLASTNDDGTVSCSRWTRRMGA